MPTQNYTFTLANGLQVVFRSTPKNSMAVMNLMYRVGSAYEDKEHTGMAHFLEHIMFGGSRHIPCYDTPLQEAGGVNNAYTSSDVTNYWCKLPAGKLEIAFWLESDRMLAPAYKDSVIETQRKVVIEEFKQGCMHKPYGDVWHLLAKQAYSVHPYGWPTIGKEIAHIEHMRKEEIIAFANRFYTPENAVLVVTGNMDVDKVHKMAEKWFAPLPSHAYQAPVLPQEPAKENPSYCKVIHKVPQNALYKAYLIPGRHDANYAAYKILSNVLTHGNSSLLYHTLVEEKALFSTIASYPTEELDPGLFLIEGKLQENVSFAKAESALEEVIQDILAHGVSSSRIKKAVHQEESAYLFAHIDPSQQAETLAYAALFQDLDFFDKELVRMHSLTKANLQSLGAALFAENNSITLHYAKST